MRAPRGTERDLPHARATDLEPLEPRRFLAADTTPALAQWLNGLPDDSPAPFDAERHGCCTPPAAGETGTAEAAEAPVTTILDNGSPSNRVDIVLVGDGYRTADLGAYAIHAQNTADNFFNEVPLSTYRPLFNVHRVDVVSVDSGVDNDPTQGVNRNTAMDMAFWCNGIERLLCVNVSKAYAFAASAPEIDQVLAIANSTKYGGAGYGSSDLGTFSGGNSSALEVARHEFGHSFADLADEYDYGDGVTYTAGERPEANVSVLTAATMQAQQRKWWRWLDLPEVDTFQGAYYAQFGIYRPTFNSKMRSLGQPWGAVNAEQLVLGVYREIRPIDAATPAGSYSRTASFFVDPVDPVGPPLDVQWLLDNQPIAGATGNTFDASSLNLPSGANYTLSARVVDNTPFVRDPVARANLLTQTVSWTLDGVAPTVTSSGFLFNQPQQTVSLGFSENVAATLTADDLALTRLDDATVIPASALAVQYTGSPGTAAFTFPGLPGQRLPDGNYRATLPAGAIADSAGNALAGPFNLDFFFLNGDANRDRSVNVGDFSLLAGSFNRVGSFSAGDFDYSGTVGIGDFSILASQFNKTLPALRPTPAAPAGEAPASPAVAVRPIRPSDDLFGIEPVDNLVNGLPD